MKKDNKTKEENIHKYHRKRMREKYDAFGANAFIDHELLEMLLFYALPVKNTNTIAHQLINRFNSLLGVLTAPKEELMTVKEVGDSTARFLNLVGDVYIRTKTSVKKNSINFSNYESTTQYIAGFFGKLKNEVLMIFFLDKGGRITGQAKIAEGGIDSLPFETSTIVSKAAAAQAYSVILAHNHPGGNVEASGDDIDSTRTIRDALLLLNIELKDHLIVADGKISSVFATGLL